MGQFTPCGTSHLLALLGLLAKPIPRPGSPSTGTIPPRAPLGGLLLAFILHTLHLIPVCVFLKVALSTAARAEPKGQVVALFSPHVLPALLLVPGPRTANAVELDQDGALPLVEALQMHPVAIGAELIVAEHPLVVVLLQVNRSAQAAAQRGRTLALWMSQDRTEHRMV